jgi:hypothetical protein
MTHHVLLCLLLSDELKFTKKKPSTEAYQAFTPANLLKLEFFWTMPPVLGVLGVPRRRFIDIDECGFAIQQTNRGSGHAFTTIRIRKPGHYCKDTKIVLIMAVEAGDPRLPAHMDGSIAKPRRWYWIRIMQGTTAYMFADFMEYVCGSIEQSPIEGLDEERFFLWDNLGSHLAPVVAQTVEARNGPCHFTSIRRPPYQPKYGPIEYVFCDISCRLKDRVNQTDTTVTLIELIQQIASQVGINGGFNNTFAHCGYSEDGVY